MSTQKTVYLAGPINGCSDSECKDWREWVKQRWPQHNYLDPMRRDYRGSEAESAAEIVSGDKEDIRKSDVFVAFCPKPSVGTSMEIFFAHQIGVRVVAVAPEPVSPWIRAHAEVLTCLDHLPL